MGRKKKTKDADVNESVAFAEHVEPETVTLEPAYFPPSESTLINLEDENDDGYHVIEYVVKPGVAIGSNKGILPAGTVVNPKWFAHGQETFDSFIALGMLIPKEVE